jgi:hypothetical protein
MSMFLGTRFRTALDAELRRRQLGPYAPEVG